MNLEQVKALFLLAGIDVSATYELANQYWPDVPQYADLRRQSPWWLVKTPAGLVKIGWRKRVVEIDWTDTGIHQVVTEDDVTKDESMVHAWSYAKAVQYLTVLASAIRHAHDNIAGCDPVAANSQGES